MAALTKTTDQIIDGPGTLKTIASATDGTNHLAAVAVLGKDGANFLPAMDDPARAGFATPSAGSIGGATPYHLTKSAANNNATVAKNAPGTVYGVEIFNYSATVKYVKLYDQTTNPNPASDTPKKVLAIPPAVSPSVGGLVRSYPVGIKFATGIAYLIVAGLDDTDNTSVAAGDITLNIDL